MGRHSAHWEIRLPPNRACPPTPQTQPRQWRTRWRRDSRRAPRPRRQIYGWANHRPINVVGDRGVWSSSMACSRMRGVSSIRRRQLGRSGIAVSELSLGSWRTYERIPREVGIAVMQRAQEVGINFLDDARYNDETGTAPVKTGYSEIVFGELFRASGWKRDEVVLANKLWWEFWPEQKAAAELDGSLQRMGLDYIDLGYAERPPAGLGMEEIVHDIGALIDAGKLRAWGVLNWKPEMLAEVVKVAAAQGVEPPCAAQLAYSLVRRSPVEDAEM